MKHITNIRILTIILSPFIFYFLGKEGVSFIYCIIFIVLISVTIYLPFLFLMPEFKKLNHSKIFKQNKQDIRKIFKNHFKSEKVISFINEVILPFIFLLWIWYIAENIKLDYPIIWTILIGIILLTIFTILLHFFNIDTLSSIIMIIIFVLIFKDLSKDYTAFIYPYGLNANENTWVIRGNFKKLDDCLDWAIKNKGNNVYSDYECGLNCKITNGAYYICKKTFQ